MEKKNINQILKVLILCVVLVAVGVFGLDFIAKGAGGIGKTKLAKQLADVSVTEIVLTKDVNVESPLEVNGIKIIKGEGRIVASETFDGEEIDALLYLKEDAEVTVGGAVVLDATGVKYGSYISKNATLILTDDAVMSNAKTSNIYNLGELEQTGGTIENGYDNVYVANGGHYLWNGGNNFTSKHYGIHVEEGAKLEVTSENAMMRESASHGIYLAGEATIDKVLLAKNNGNQIDITKTGSLILNGGDIAYGLNNGINNLGSMVMNGGSINSSAYSGIMNSGELEIKVGDLLNNGESGIHNRNGGKLIIKSKEVTIVSNAYGITNEENTVCEVAYAKISSNTTNNINNLGDMNIHDITLKVSGSTSVYSAYGAHTILKNVVIDGTGKNHGVFCERDALVELDTVTIKNIAEKGIHVTNGEVIGKNLTFENVTQSNVNTEAHKRLGGGKITITDSTLGASGTNNVAIKAGEVHLINVKIQGNFEGKDDTVHGIYAREGKLYLTDCTISNTTGSAIRNNGGYVEATNLKVSNNTVHNIFASAGETVLKNSTLAASDYHHVYCKGGTVAISDCVLQKGVKSTLSVTADGKVSVKNSTLEATSSNNVTITGGKTTFDNVKVLGNLPKCDNSTHGVYVKGGRITLENSTIASTTGSAIRNDGGTVTATNLKVNGITEHNVFSTAGTTVIEDSILTASNYHHIYTRGGNVKLEKVTLEAGVKSAISTPEGTTTVLNSTLEQTTSNSLTITGGTVNLENTKVLGHQAGIEDTSLHIVYLTGGALNLKNSSLENAAGSAIRNNGGTVEAVGLSVGNVTEHNVFSTAGTTVIKNSILAASNYHHIYTKGGNVKLEKVTLEAGVKSAISTPEGTTTVLNSTLEQTTSNSLTITGGTVNLENTKVLGHMPDIKDTAIHVAYLTGGALNIKNSSLENSAGSAIRNNGGTVVADSLTVSGANQWNSFTSAGTTTIKNSTLNPATVQGYVVNTEKGNTVLENVTCLKSDLLEGQTTQKKGFVHVEGGSVTIKDSVVEGGTKCQDGLYVNGGSLKATNISVKNVNRDAIRNEGGAVEVDNFSVVNIANWNAYTKNVKGTATTTIKNSKLKPGNSIGHIVNVTGTTNLENVTCLKSDLLEGQTTQKKGFVHVEGGSVNIKDSVVEGGTKCQDGLYVLGNAVVMISNTTIKNIVRDAIRNEGGTVEVDKLSVENVENWNIYTTIASKQTAAKTTIKNSTLNAGNTTGHIVNVKGTTTVDNCILLEANGSVVDKGIVHVEAGIVTVNNSTLKWGTRCTSAISVLKTGTVIVSDTTLAGKINLAGTATQPLTLKGKVMIYQISIASENIPVTLDGKLTEGSSVKLQPVAAENNVVVKSANEEDMTANMTYLSLTDDLTIWGLKLDGVQAILSPMN